MDLINIFNYHRAQLHIREYGVVHTGDAEFE